MNIKKLKKDLILVSIISIIGLVAVIGVVTVRSLSHPRSTAGGLIPTKDISSHTSVGGTVVHEGASTTDNKTPATVTTPSSESTPQTSRPPSQNVAPKQQAIADEITQQFTYHAYAAPMPNDPYYGVSWAMNQTQASGAWVYSTGSPVTVAVIDTGFALQHEDLRTQWAANSGETGTTTLSYDKGLGRCVAGTVLVDKASNGCDDDNNGYVDDWRGWNFVSVNNNPQAGLTTTNGTAAISHGTAVSGLIAAATNNGVGVASYDWNAKVMPLQVLDDSGSGLSSSVVPAIHYAVDNGAQIINMSLGGPDDDPALASAIAYAYSHNVIVVAAAGNCGTGTENGCDPTRPGAMGYPALYNHVIAVGATDATGARASFSSYGPRLDVVAPGSGTIISTLIDTSTAQYNYTSAYSGSLYGTSFATPIVSGAAALIRSYRTTSSVDDITALIDGTAQKTTGMNGLPYTDQYGHGLLSAQGAMTVANSLNTTQATPTLAQTGNYKSEHTFSSDATMSSGCAAATNSYCTVRINNAMSGADRYLPYKKTDTAGQAGWQWPGSILQPGSWNVYAVQGTSSSPSPYGLFSK